MVNRTRLPVGPGISFTVAPAAVSRSTNFTRNSCSSSDSSLGTLVSTLVTDQSSNVGTDSVGALVFLPLDSSWKRYRSAVARETESICQGVAKGSKHLWQARRGSSRQVQSLTLIHALWMMSHTRCGSANSAR